MSVIVKDLQKDKIFLLTKGADSIIIDRLQNDQGKNVESTMFFVKEYATNGLRTLLLA